MFEEPCSVFSVGWSRWLGQHLWSCCGSLTMCSCLTYKCLCLTNPDVVHLGKVFEAKIITGMWSVRLCQQGLHTGIRTFTWDFLTSSVLTRTHRLRKQSGFSLWNRPQSMNTKFNLIMHNAIQVSWAILPIVMDLEGMRHLLDANVSLCFIAHPSISISFWWYDHCMDVYVLEYFGWFKESVFVLSSLILFGFLFEYSHDMCHTGVVYPVWNLQSLFFAWAKVAKVAEFAVWRCKA